MKQKWKTGLLSFLVFFLFFFSLQDVLHSESLGDDYRLNRESLTRFSFDFRETLLSPTKWKKKDLILFSSLAASSVLLYVFDEDIYKAVQDRKDPFTSDLSRVVSGFGDAGYLVAFAASLYVIGEVGENRGLRKTALLSLESLAISGAVVLSLKFAVGRARPQKDEGSQSFHPFSMKNSYASFPSGHAASAFSVATTIAEQSPKAVVDILAYSLASLVALSRVHDRKHWPSDILVGSAIGYFVAKKVSDLNRGRQSSRLSFSFHIAGSRSAVTLCFSF